MADTEDEDDRKGTIKFAPPAPMVGHQETIDDSGATVLHVDYADGTAFTLRFDKDGTPCINANRPIEYDAETRTIRVVPRH